MKFTAKTEDLRNALKLVKVVTPKPLTQKDGPVYLFSVRGQECFVYSRDQYRVSRASFPITDVEGEGPFVYPSQFTDSFKFVDETITFETVDGPDTWSVKYTTESGAGCDRTTFDPSMTSSCDRDLDSAVAECTFPAAILREAISLSQPFLAQPTDTKPEEHYKTLQIFDKNKPDWVRGDGYMFASDSTSAFYFQCPAFEGKSLEIHSEHLPLLATFLSKCDGDVTFKKGANYTFVTDGGGTVLGWTHHTKTHGKFAYYSLAKDNYILHAEKSILLKALEYTRSELDTKKDRVKLLFDYQNETIQFTIAEGNAKATSFPVPTQAKQKLDKNLNCVVNIDRFINLIKQFKGNTVVLRFAILPANGKTDTALIRTIDEFRLDSNGKVTLDTEKSFPCQVTRFVPSN